MKNILTALVAVFLLSFSAQAAVLYTPHFIQFFDDDGAPCAGCKLYTYAAGTTTPKATYTTAAGNIENANPVVMDASGRATIFLSGAYKFILNDADDNPIETTDNVTAFATSAGSVDDITTNFSEASVASGDSFVFADVSDSNTTKRDTIDGITDVVSSTLAFKSADSLALSDKITFYDASDSYLPKTDTIDGIRDALVSSGTVATTSGTSAAATGLSCGKRLTVDFIGVSLSGTDRILLQFGSSGGYATSTYSSIAVNGSGSSDASVTSGHLLMFDAANSRSYTGHAHVTFSSSSQVIVTDTALASFGNNSFEKSGGNKTITGTFDRFRIVPSGSDTFDAGSINYQCE